LIVNHIIVKHTNTLVRLLFLGIFVLIQSNKICQKYPPSTLERYTCSVWTVKLVAVSGGRQNNKARNKITFLKHNGTALKWSIEYIALSEPLFDPRSITQTEENAAC
jgi:hypothetical protein